MFNSTILDVAIGMVFVYLLLSLMCTAANEIIELMLKKRAIDLERGIRELLARGSNSGNPDIVQDLYNHSLINGLFEGRYENSRIATRLRWVVRTKLPSYIPARNFSVANGSNTSRRDSGRYARWAIRSNWCDGAFALFSESCAVVVNVAGGAAPVVVPSVSPTPNPSMTLRGNGLVGTGSDPAVGGIKSIGICWVGF